MIGESIINNQALNMHGLFFDPVNRDLERYTDKEGRPMGRYVEKPVGAQVLANGDVVFRYLAPNAKKVQVAGLGGSMGNERYDMSLGENGCWSVTVSGIPAGFHYHEYFVDGNRCASDLAPYGYGCSRFINFVDVPDNDSLWYLLQNVPHGTVRMDYYNSTVTGRMRNCFVYTPPGYEKNTDKRYPVLYLQHGGGESETSWLWHGKINYILDNLIAAGECREMIVVMNSGYSFYPDGTGHPARGCFDELLIKDCIPFIDGKYRTMADRRSRSMAGLSMGGFQTQATVLKNLDYFSSLGMFSAVLIYNNGEDDYSPLMADMDKFNSSLDLFFISAGDDEPMLQSNIETLKPLKEKGLECVEYSLPGHHEWQVWRYSAKQFLKQVFAWLD